MSIKEILAFPAPEAGEKPCFHCVLKAFMLAFQKRYPDITSVEMVTDIGYVLCELLILSSDSKDNWPVNRAAMIKNLGLTYDEVVESITKGSSHVH